MSLVSLTFFAFVAVTVIAYHAWASVAWRRAVLGVANAAFIASYLDDATEALPLLGFLAVSYCGMQAVRRRPGGGVLAAVVLVVLATYIVLKRFSFLDGVVQLPFPYLIVGLSYILFRVLQVIVDVRSADAADRELLAGIGPLAFFRYTCNFLCFVSGPIQRYQDFATMDGRDAVVLDADRVFHAFSRVVGGYVKFVILAGSADYLFTNVNAQLAAALTFDATAVGLVKLVLIFAACAATYTAYLYLNFAGYMDIVIGIGLLLGQTLPENFDRPFSARSFLEFWQRWHMTLSNWFRIYLFNPFLMFLMTRFPQPALTSSLGVVAFFVTFLVMGVWHGTTVVFVVYGLLMGAGASVNKLWQLACADRLGRKRYRALTQTTGYIYLARGLTIGYFATALTCLWTPEPARFLLLAARLGPLGVTAAVVLLSLGFAASVFVIDAAGAWIGARRGRWQELSTGFLSRNVNLAARILAVLAVNSLFNKAPDFVYKAF